MSLQLALLSSHAPSLLHGDQAPDYQQPIVRAFHRQRELIKRIKPDALVIISSHFLTNWKHYVDATPRHEGFLTAREHPDMIANIPFNYPGDEELANELARAGEERAYLLLRLMNQLIFGLWDSCPASIFCSG